MENDGRLCVRCGHLGHVTTVCRDAVLSASHTYAAHTYLRHLAEVHDVIREIVKRQKEADNIDISTSPHDTAYMHQTSEANDSVPPIDQLNQVVANSCCPKRYIFPFSTIQKSPIIMLWNNRNTDSLNLVQAATVTVIFYGVWPW